MNQDYYGFPRGFVWGAATASYQIEGACGEDGKGASIWDTFTHENGGARISDRSNGDVACDHYHRLDEDLAILKRLGIKAYRFSLAWPRIFPQGKGSINWRGLEFYDRLIDSLLALRIEPFVTLYHWDLPQALQDSGGWAARDTAGYFADYAAVVTKRFGDRVRRFITLNEPWCSAFLGNRDGEHAPGLKDEKTALQVAHNLLVAHGMATSAMRAIEPGLEVGIALNLTPVEPVNEKAETEAQARNIWARDSAWFLDPLFRGCYPPDALAAYGEIAPEIKPNDFALISQKLDFLGVNYYFRSVVSDKGVVPRIATSEYTEMGWEVHAPALKRLLLSINRDYRLPPIYITENGIALDDHLVDEHVHDPRRIRYIHDHLVELRTAMREGVKVEGYFCWSLMDNFEWAWGHSKRFGLVYVDYATQARYIKDSGYWYAKVASTNEVHR